MTTSRKCFEYLAMETTANSPQPDERWMQLGADGWELIAVQLLEGAVSGMSPMEISVTKSRLIFKREILT